MNKATIEAIKALIAADENAALHTTKPRSKASVKPKNAAVSPAMPTPYWDKEEVLGVYPNNAGTSAIRVALTQKADNEMIHIGKFVKGKDDMVGTYKQHTTHAVSIMLEDVTQLHELIASLQRIERSLKAVK